MLERLAQRALVEALVLPVRLGLQVLWAAQGARDRLVQLEQSVQRVRWERRAREALLARQAPPVRRET